MMFSLELGVVFVREVVNKKRGMCLFLKWATD